MWWKFQQNENILYKMDPANALSRTVWFEADSAAEANFRASARGFDFAEGRLIPKGRYNKATKKYEDFTAFRWTQVVEADGKQKPVIRDTADYYDHNMFFIFKDNTVYNLTLFEYQDGMLGA